MYFQDANEAKRKRAMVSVKTIFHYFLFSNFLIMKKKTHTQSFTLEVDLSLISTVCANQYYVISFYCSGRGLLFKVQLQTMQTRQQTLIKFGNSEVISQIGIISSRSLTSSYLHCIRTCISAVHIFLYACISHRTKKTRGVFQKAFLWTQW